jgi:uncharacterized protein
VSLKRTAEQVLKEKLSVGGSIVHIKKQGDAWKPVLGSKFNKRFTALYPKIEMSGPTAQYLPTGTGTLANCSGGRTPWMTVLSCEENYPDYNDKVKGYGWSLVEGAAIDEREYGWVVEVDPFGELPPMKHTALGRFKHENAALHIGKTGKLVVYMGDDEADQCLYKFVSARPLDRQASRADQRKVLTEGTLYAADFLNGKWLPLDLKRSPALRDAEFLTQAEVMVRTRAAAAALKATPLDRCEDCEVHPDGSLYVALTNNEKHGNFFGQIVRLIEEKDDPEGEAFQYEIFLAGGPRSGLACPDNLAFDPKANLWVVCDISSKVIGKGAYKPFGNNGLYVVPTSGDSMGDAFQFASGPKDCELTGPWFTEDASTLFLAVQHPGEESKSVTDPTSNWPDGKGHVPRPSVVAVSGFKW